MIKPKRALNSNYGEQKKKQYRDGGRERVLRKTADINNCTCSKTADVSNEMLEWQSGFVIETGDGSNTFIPVWLSGLANLFHFPL